VPALITVTVDTTTDSNDAAYQACTDAPNDCSLRGAVSRFNHVPSTEATILLPSGTYTLTIAGPGEDANDTGDLDVKWGNTTIVAAGASETVIDGDQLDRVLHVHLGAGAEVWHVTLTNGKAPDGASDPFGNGQAGAPGGGVYNAGFTTLAECTITNNAAGSGGAGGHGGGIYNAGAMALRDSTVAGDAAGVGGSARDGGQGGHGGASTTWGRWCWSVVK
jgi:hypothetical protein